MIPKRAYKRLRVKTLFKIFSEGEKGKVLLDFFQKIADSKGRAFGRLPQQAEALRGKAHFSG